MAAGKQDRVAKRYARALFEVCPPTEFDATHRQLKSLGAAWSASLEFRQSMLNPSIQDAARLELVETIVSALAASSGHALHDRGAWANEATRRTVRTLVSLRKAAALPAVAEAFAYLVAQYRKSLTLAVTVAKPVTPEVVSAVTSQLSQSLGGEVTITVKHDPALLGGMTVRLGDRLLDRSVAGTLQRIAAQLE
jgi:F-type H+-transporting ATPase subunit delta